MIIRNPNATRPWQHVLEPLSGYMKLAEKLTKYGGNYAEAWNFGPLKDETQSVELIVEKISNLWGGNLSWSIDQDENPHEATILNLDCSKAFDKLHWSSKWNLDQTLLKIVEWYKEEMKETKCNELCLSQIEEYTNICDI